MTIEFHTDFYPRAALETAAATYRGRAGIEFATSGAFVVARVEPRMPLSADDLDGLLDDFCNEALSATARELRRSRTGSPNGRRGLDAPPSRRIAPRLDTERRAIAFEFDLGGVSTVALFEALLAFAERSYLFVTRTPDNGVLLAVRPKGEPSTDSLKTLIRDVTRSLNQLVRSTRRAPDGGNGRTSLPPQPPRAVDLEALIAELEAADPMTVGVGVQPQRGPGHGPLRVLNVRGTGACNSECIFCIEKFVPGHRPMPTADATHDLIVDSAGEYDMLFFAAGEPTIHPKLFQYVEIAKGAGFTRFGMSSHFRTFADPRFALKTLQAGFQYFDIALHAADRASQLDVNPIGDEGRSLDEALKGLAVLLSLAHALGIPISITHKIVVSKLNFDQLEPIFRATYDRGVRHYILQPVRSSGLAPDLFAKLDMPQDDMLPYVNDLLQRTEGLGAVIKPYGFSRLGLLSLAHVEHEQNRVKNIYGKSKNPPHAVILPVQAEGARPADARYWVQLTADPDARYAFASDGDAPILDTALARGLNLNYGCRMGSCGSCGARLLQGRVDQRSQIFLSDEQIRQGFVLLCQARPLSDVVVKLCTEDVIDGL